MASYMVLLHVWLYTLWFYIYDFIAYLVHLHLISYIVLLHLGFRIQWFYICDSIYNTFTLMTSYIVLLHQWLHVQCFYTDDFIHSLTIASFEDHTHKSFGHFMVSHYHAFRKTNEKCPGWFISKNFLAMFSTGKSINDTRKISKGQQELF